MHNLKEAEKVGHQEVKEMRTETFTIGQVAEITGISRDRLRYYEEKGILYPAQDKGNNYRSYSLTDIDTILSIEFYRSMDLGMAEISQIWASGEPEKIAYLLEEKKKEITSKIDELQQYLKNIGKGKEACERIAEHLDRFSIRPMPAFEVLGEISDYRSFSEYRKILDKKDELEGNPIVNSLKRMIVFSEKGIEKDRMLITGDAVPKAAAVNKRMEFDRCLYTIVEDSAENGDILDEMFEKSGNWAKENKLKPKGIVIINMILITVHKRTAKSYLEIFAPIE